MASQIPTRRPLRVAKPANDENAPARLSTLQKAKATATASIDNAKNNAKTIAVAKPVVRAKPSVGAENAPGAKRKRGERDTALSDATNGKGKTVIPSYKTTKAAENVDAGKASSTHQRASSISKTSTTVAPSQATARARAPLATKSKNVTSTAGIRAASEKPADSGTDSTASNTKVVRRPLTTKSAAASNVKAIPTRTREVTKTTVHVETKTRQVVNAGKVHMRKVSKTKVEAVNIEETDVDEDEVRSHKRPRLSSEHDEGPAIPIIPEATKEITSASVTVEEVKELIASVRGVKAEEPVHDDLDKEDADDPLMVAEYVVEIFDYLKALELTTMPNPRYMESQKGLKDHMRGILGDWIINIHRSMRMVPETLFICMNLVDRFLSVRAISVQKVQLVGIVCLLIASKYEEICAPSVKVMLHFSAEGSKAEEIKEAERYVLKSLQWNLSYTSPITFLRRISKADGFDPESRTVAKYLVEIYCVEYAMIQFTPSCIAAAAMWLGRLALDRGDWNANLAHYSGYKEEELLPCANVLLNYILKYPQHDAIYKKYASRKFSKVSVYMRSWALERWDEGSDVDLAACLEALLEDSAQRRLEGKAAVVTMVPDPPHLVEEEAKQK